MYYVYILASRSLVLYIGVTNDLVRRVAEHKQKIVRGFTAKYNVDRLLYFETFSNPADAIHREKQLKGWTRAKKVDLIRTMNPELGGNTGSVLGYSAAEVLRLTDSWQMCLPRRDRDPSPTAQDDRQSQVDIIIF